MADYGEGFTEVNGKLECTKHGARFLANRINSEDVAETFCLKCNIGELTEKGLRELARRERGESVEQERERLIDIALNELVFRVTHDHLGPQGIAAEKRRAATTIREVYSG